MALSNEKELVYLRQKVQELTQENMDLRISLDMTTEHSDAVEHELLAVRSSLERKVEERTQELAEYNSRLQREIQERKRVEDVQRNSLLFRQILLNSIPNPIYFKNLFGMYLGCNKAFENAFGLTESQIVGYTANDIFSVEYAEKEYEKDQILFKNSQIQVQTYEEKLTYSDETIRDVIINKTSFNASDGTLAGLVGIIIDISEHKRAEDALLKAKETAEDANRIKTEFLANMSHELRTPLNAILGYSEMLQEDMADMACEELVPDIQKVHAAGKHLLGLINDILDISKIEAGKMNLYNETFEVETAIHDVVATIQPLIQNKNNQLEVLHSEELGSMHADLTKVRQMLFNLLSNAAKFTENGTIRLRVYRRSDERNDWIFFEVQDQGIGMTKKQLEKLFQPFTQADASTTRKYGGTGLGLTISKRFAEMMGGQITVKSQLGKGSTFCIRMPVFVITDVTQMLEGKNIPENEIPHKGNVVLVIDDDPVVRELLQNYVNKLGFQVVTAEGGKEGLELAKKLLPHAITLDVMMPGVDGWMVLSELKRTPELAHIPVIMVSLIEDKSIGYALGAAEYLTKPVNREELSRVLNKYLVEEGGTQNILVVEDDAVTRHLIYTMLKKAGWEVLQAENGNKALSLLEGDQPDIILSDLMMPEMDGFEFINELRSKEDWRSIPVVVLTAKDMTPEERALLNNRVEKIFQKGTYRREELLSEIRECLMRVQYNDKQE